MRLEIVYGGGGSPKHRLEMSMVQGAVQRGVIDAYKARCEIRADISLLVDGLGPRMDIII